MKKGTRVDGGKVKINEHGEMYIERRGRKPGNKVKKAPLSHASSSSSLAGGQHVGVARRRASVRNALRRGIALNTHASRLADLKERYVSRRSLLFKAHCPSKAPSTRTAIRCLEHAWHNNVKYSVGDIVAVTDEDDNMAYFAQIRGMVVDPMMNGYAALTWLIPMQSAPDPNSFDAEHFAHGLVDKKNYSLKVCEWVAPRPSLAAYRSEWNPRKAAAHAMRAEAVTRWKQLRAVADEELRREEQRPILNLEDRKNEEKKWV